MGTPRCQWCEQTEKAAATIERQSYVLVALSWAIIFILLAGWCGIGPRP